jgi:hypothetical protein
MKASCSAVKLMLRVGMADFPSDIRIVYRLWHAPDFEIVGSGPLDQQGQISLQTHPAREQRQNMRRRRGPATAQESP